MYSVVLMMAMTSGGDVTALGHGCNGGCYGCYGGSYSKHGHSCGGGHARGHSCGGGHARGHSCFGGCLGGGMNYGCNSCCNTRGHKHQRGHGCCGYTSCCQPTCGCQTSCFTGCCGSSVGGFSGTVVPTTGTMAPPLAPTAPVVPGKKTSFEGAAPATLIVNVPAEARLTIDGQATISTAAQRVFVSPALEAGRTFHYTVSAEIVKDGKTITVSKKVAVTAGEESRVTLNADNIEFASR